MLSKMFMCMVFSEAGQGSPLKLVTFAKGARTPRVRSLRPARGFALSSRSGALPFSSCLSQPACHTAFLQVLREIGQQSQRANDERRQAGKRSSFSPK